MAPMGEVIPFGKYGVYQFFWGTAVKDERRQKWTTIILNGGKVEIDVENIPVEIHENGIEFLR